MSDWGHLSGPQIGQVGGANVSTSGGTAVSVPGANNAKGSWTEMIASTEYPICGLLLLGYLTAGSAITTLIDIGTGAASSEVVRVANIQQRRNGSGNASFGPIYVPFKAPAGTRISARYQASTASGSVLNMSVVALAAPGNGAYDMDGAYETWGAVTASSSGTVVDPGATINTKGSWTELIASTTFTTRWLYLSVDNSSTAATAGTNWLLDIGVGVASSEVVRIPDVQVYATNIFDTSMWGVLIRFEIPAGSRVAARLQSSINTATARNREVIVHAFG